MIREKLGCAIWVIITLGIIIGTIYFGTIGYQNEETHVCTVQDKWVKLSSKSSDKYLVQCGNEVYEITDLLFKGKFNSSDIYANLKVGKKYEITTTGYRFELFSMYKNINEYEVKEDE